MWQEVAEVLEAIVLEKALQLRARYSSWLEVAKAIHAAAPSSWPKTLGDSAAFNVSLEISPLSSRLKAKFPPKSNCKRTVAAARKKAVAILARSQLYKPGPDTSLWDYCIPKMHQIVNTGKLTSLERSRSDSRSKARARPAGSQKKAKAATPASPPSSPVRALKLPGQKRGGPGTKGGRCGAIPVLVKIAVQDLMVECNVKMRNVPKVWAIVCAGLSGEVPDVETLFTQSHISEWIIDLAGGEMLREVDAFWACRAKYPDIKLHVHHDATGRSTFEVGKDAKLMLFYASYFNPDLKRAVTIILNLRALPGSGSAAATARALAVNLEDMGLYKIKSSADPATAFVVEVLKKDVLGDLGSDNTASAINVADEMAKLTGEKIESWPCPTHINALDGLNPINAVFGKKVGGATTESYNVDHVLNVHAKVTYIWGKHRGLVGEMWKSLKCEPAWKLLSTPPDGQVGKWETMGPALDWVINHAPELRKVMAKIEFMTTNLDGLGSLHTDAGKLWRWLCDPDIYFGVLAARAWFVNTIEPTYELLHSPSAIHPESGPHFRRHEMARLALDKLAVVRTFGAGSPLNVEWTADKAKAVALKYIPEAVELLVKAAPRDEGCAAQRFEVKADERDALLIKWAAGYWTALTANWDNHWYKFLRGANIFGLATDPELGPWFARRLLAIVDERASRAAGSHKDVAVPGKAAELVPLLEQQMIFVTADLVKELGLGTPAMIADWLLLADPAKHAQVDWSRESLPALAPFLESKFFGGFHGNLPLEQIFSVYGNHVETEQSMKLKESIVTSNVRLMPDRAKRAAVEMRAKELTEAKRAKLSSRKQKTGALDKSDVSKKQLVAMCQQMLRRSKQTTLEGIKKGDAFALKREKSWDMLTLREKKAMDGVMKAARAKGRAQPVADPFGHVRGEKRKKMEQTYLDEAQGSTSPPPMEPPGAAEVDGGKNKPKRKRSF